MKNDTTSENYYEFLSISSTASRAEIEEEIDKQRDYWRMLVVNLDPIVAAEANLKVLTLEKARATLTDPENRKNYDQSLRETGGLQDLSTEADKESLNFSNPASNFGRSGYVKPISTDLVDVWVCPNKKCHTANPLNTGFCKKCGKQLGIDCPNCGKLTELQNPFCTNCGVDLKKAIAEKEFEEQLRIDEEQKQLHIKEEAERIEAQVAPYKKRANRAMVLSSIFWVMLFWPIAPILWIISISLASSVIVKGLAPGFEEPYMRATKARKRAAIQLGIVFIGLLVALIFSVILGFIGGKL